MIQSTDNNNLIKLCATEVKDTFQRMAAFTAIFKNLPVAESVKSKMVGKATKEKAAWYACIVNPNIDVLLLSEYFDAKQSRNILLKKETDQYQITISHFAELRTLNSHQSVYENLLTEKDEEVVQTSFDLFSTHKVVRETCPDKIKKLFSQWQLKNTTNTEFETLLLQFNDWHALNNFSFNGQRHLVLWFNYQLWKLFGDGALFFNVEHFFFHHWNKESRDNVMSIKELIKFLSDSCSKLQQDLLAMYRDEIGFNDFQPEQKIANNYLTLQGFQITDLPVNADDYSVHLNKVIAKKGFVSNEDITFKVQLEKLLVTLQQLAASGRVKVVIEQEKWWAGLIAGERKTDRLQSYCNVSISTVEPEWEMLQQVQPIRIQPVKKAVETVSISEPQLPRQKAFFG
ncbi:MAG: hypothetical protein V4613_04465 [Bacteroidota bacterium]